MLTKGDEYPIHQTPEPVAYAAPSRNFYDRFFFNGYNKDGSVFFAAAMGIYPHVNVIDGAFSIVHDGVQRNTYGSRVLHMERLNTFVGAVRVEIVKPLETLRLLVDDSKNGIKADLTLNFRCAPQEEPRFTRRTGAMLTMDLTRMTQNGDWSGWIELQGKRIDVTPDQFRGTRDRSWGIRQIGMPDPQPNPYAEAPQFYWLWAPLNFDDLVTLYHVNEYANGEAWNSHGLIVPLLRGGSNDQQTEHMAKTSNRLKFKPGTRHATAAEIHFERANGEKLSIDLAPKYNFYMKGIGYGHPTWGHGRYHGPQESVGYDEFKTADVNPKDGSNLHIQAVCAVTLKDGKSERKGTGVLEQMFIGPHDRSGFKEMMDFAP